MKNIYNKNKEICTIISDTPYSKDETGEFVGLDPTVEEIDHLSSLFKQIYHFAPLYNYKPPKSLQDTNEFISFIMDPFQLWRAEKEIVSDDEDDDDTPCDKKSKNIWLKKKSVHELV